MKEAHVTIKWQVEDGYVSGSRPHTTEIALSDFEDDMTPDDIQDLICEIVQEDFSQSISFSLDNLDEAAAEVQAHLEGEK